MSEAPRLGLSKSRLSAFNQCAKRLWLEVHKRELRVFAPEAAHFFNVGHQVGEIAQRQYPHGILIESDDDLDRAVAETAAVLPERRPIFEATFRFDDVLIRADLLLPVDGGWHMAEVKSTASVKSYHLSDIAAQVWVAENSGVPITRATVRHIDTTFVYAEEHNYGGLLIDVDVIDNAREVAATLPQTILDARAAAQGAEPEVRTGDHCDKPFGCPFHRYCQSQEPPGPRYSVGLLPGSSGKRIAAELRGEGLDDLALVPAERITNLALRRIHQATSSGEPYWDAAGAQKAISAWPWPHQYLDFETVGPAVPVWLGARPYAAAAFQFSLHTLHVDGSLSHSGFLDLSGSDPSRACAEALLAQLGSEGTIVSYSAFERTTIRALAQRVPDLADQLTALESRIVDLLPAIKEHYYHRDMMGSYSIKAVQPVLAPHLDYEALGEVRDGLSAQMAYLEAVAPTCSDERRAELRQKLENYCALDTLAMVTITKNVVDTSASVRSLAAFDRPQTQTSRMMLAQEGSE